MNDSIVRGDIFFANLNYRIGSEQSGYRPVLIIQNNIGNRFSPTVIVAAITGKIHYKAKMPTHCILDSYQKLYNPSMVLLEQIITIDKRRLKKYIGRINQEELVHINKALSISVGLENLHL